MSTSTINVIRKKADVPYSVTIHPCNGDDDAAVVAKWPHGKYSFLYTPEYDDDHMFIGWYTSETGGDPITSDDLYSNSVTDVYARWAEATTVTFSGDFSSVTSDSVKAFVGFPIGTLPDATYDSGDVLLYWKTPSGSSVTESTVYDGSFSTLSDEHGTLPTKFSVYTTSDTYKSVGIYLADRIDQTKPIVVVWGDGTRDVIRGSVSKLKHEYPESGKDYTMSISDNVLSLSMSSNDGTWFTSGATGSNNYYNLREVLSVSPRISRYGSYAFYQCRYLKITPEAIGSGLTSIPDYCFYYCNYADPSYGSIVIGKGITSIGSYAFFYNQYVSSLRFEERDGSPLTLGVYCFSGVLRNLTASVVVPEGVTSIPDYCFSSNYRVSDITIPSTVTSIGSSAFATCRYLNTIRCNAMTAPTVQSNSFGTSTTNYVGYYDKTDTKKLVVKSGATGYDAGYWLDPLCNPSKCNFHLTTE